jgi:hypothetical protein
MHVNMLAHVTHTLFVVSTMFRISADDAASWQRLNAAAPYERRMDTHLTVLKNGVMFVAGGDCGGTCNKNDVWASVDGSVIFQSHTYIN